MTLASATGAASSLRARLARSSASSEMSRRPVSTMALDSGPAGLRADPVADQLPEIVGEEAHHLRPADEVDPEPQRAEQRGHELLDRGREIFIVVGVARAGRSARRALRRASRVRGLSIAFFGSDSNGFALRIRLRHRPRVPRRAAASNGFGERLRRRSGWPATSALRRGSRPPRLRT